MTSRPGAGVSADSIREHGQDTPSRAALSTTARAGRGNVFAVPRAKPKRRKALRPAGNKAYLAAYNGPATAPVRDR
jgi:hypothetical protein